MMINKMIKQTKSFEHPFIPFTNTKNILFLLDSEINIKELNKIFRNCFFIIYKQGSKQLVYKDNILIFGKKQCNFYGMPNQKIFDCFSSLKNEIVFDLTTESYFPIVSLLAFSKNKYRCGIHQYEKSGILDLILLKKDSKDTLSNFKELVNLYSNLS